MVRFISILLLLALLAAPAMGQDPGNLDSLIIGTVQTDPGVPSAMIPIYAVTDDPVAGIVLPIQWDNPDGRIHPGGVYYFGSLLSWDQMQDSLDLTDRHLIITGVNDTGGVANPVINTAGERQLVMMLRMVIHPEADDEDVPISSFIDSELGPAQFILDDGTTTFEPVIVDGALVFHPLVVDEPLNLPNKFNLEENYPNPFNAHTEIGFAVSSRCHVRLDIHDILGRKIRTLVAGQFDTGYYRAIWDGKSDNGVEVASGLYFYTLKTEAASVSRKMLLLK